MALADEDIQFTLDYTASFATFGAGPIDVRILVVNVSDDVVLSGEVDLETWWRAYNAGAFHLDDEEEPAGWEPGYPVQLVLRLRDPLTRRFDDAEPLLEELVSDESSPLRHSEAWVALEATQEVPVPDMPDATASVGIRTSWADPLGAE